MNVCRLVEYEGDFGSRFWLLFTSQSRGLGRGEGGYLKQWANLANNMICDVGVERVILVL